MAVCIWVVVGACILVVKFGRRVKVYGRTPADSPAAFLVLFPSAWQHLVRPGVPTDR